MKTISFNKQILATMAIALLCCFTAKAQDTKEWSIIPYTKIGYVLDGSVRLLDEVYHANAGVDAKVSFNEHWSLLAGVEYNYRWGFSEGGYIFPDDHREGLRHFIRIPVRHPHSCSRRVHAQMVLCQCRTFCGTRDEHTL